MYYAKYGNEYLHDPYTDNCLVADLSMTGKINEKGSAKFTIAPTHPLYTKIKLKDFSDPIYIYNDKTILFDGYIYDASVNFDLTMDINCYGALGYLEDITLRPYATSKSQNDDPGLIYINGTLDTYLEWIFDEYNSRCTSGKNLKLGKNESKLILPSNYISRSSNEYPTVASELEDKVLDKVGGYFFLRHDGKTRYVDYFSECTDVNTQVIDFGENLLDFTQSNSTDSMYTSVIPVGSTTRLMLNGSEVSGANYLEDSGGWGPNSSSSKWSSNDSSASKVETSETDGRYCMHGSGTVGQTSTSIKLEWDTPYVYSAYIKFENSGEVSFNSPLYCWCEYTNESSDFSGPTIDGIYSNSVEIIDISNGNKYNGKTTVSANRWYKIVQYFRTIHQPSGYTNCLFRPWISGELANGGWWLYWIKLEKGSIQSDWTSNKDNDAQFVSVPLNIKDYPDGQLSQAGFSKYEDSVRYDYAVSQYGIIEKNTKYSDYGDMSLLVSSAITELNSYATPVKTITIKAIDLALLNKDYKALAPGQLVRIRSTPHNVDQYMMLSEMDVDLEDPSNTEYTFGITYDTLTGQQSKKITALNASINKSLDAVSALTPEVKAAAKNSDDAKNDASDAAAKADKANQTANNASQKADDASQKAEEADNKATSASQQANSALTASKDAADKASAASKAADEASAKATLAETNSSEAKKASQDAINAANDANTAATTATTTANKASEDAANAIKSAKSANDAATDAASKADAAATEVGKVKSQIDDVNGEITNIKGDATKLQDDLTGQITSVKETMEADYAKNTDLTATSETLRNEITNSAAGTLQTVSSTYAKKTELETTTTLAQEAKDAASTNAKDLTNAINKVNSDMSSLQDQIDGAIETWFFDGVPSNDNKPASDWTTDTLKNNHLGDLYYDNLTGYSYRWQIQNGVYSWARITDVDVTKALKDAKNAQETANSKRRVFSDTPYPPYDEGDLWVQGKSGDILRCTVAKSADQTYADADWSLASKYTDDSAVTTLKNTVETTYATKTTVETLSDKWSSTASSVETVKVDLKAAQESAKQANEAATAAQESANTAIENAATAQTKADEAAKTASDATANAATANTAAANAQKAADEAAKKAATAQSNADTANAELATAKKKLEEIQNQANATDEQVAAAKAAVEKAQSAADKANEAASSASTAASSAQEAADTAKANAATAQSTADTAKANAAIAQSTADTAKTNAATAQSTADTAKKTADKATEDLAAVTNRVTIAETNISNNAEAINLRATKTEVKQAINDASASSKSYTDAQLKITSESITTTVSKTYATKADLDTTNENVTNAQNTADSVKEDLANNYTTTTDMNSKIEQSASSITSTVAAKYATKTTVDALKNIADSAIETWTGKGVPILTNLPASKWDTDELKKQHSGDLYYDTDTNYAYRFSSEDGINYSWSLIKDTEITKALADAAKAQNTANSANTAASNAQKTADTANTTASSVKDDLANNYTTTTDMNSKIEQSASSITTTVSKTYATKAALDTTNENVTNAQNTADSANTAASNAQKTADTANTTANSVKENLANNYTTTTDMNSQIKVESDRITSAVSRITNTENNITTLSGNMTNLSTSLSETQTQLVQNSETLTARIINAEKSIGDQTTTMRNVDSYMQFADPNGGSPQLTIGTSTSDMKTVLTNDQLRFEKNGVALLTVDGASSSVKTKNLTLGGYQWQSPDTDRLQLVYIGGE